MKPIKLPSPSIEKIDTIANEINQTDLTPSIKPITTNGKDRILFIPSNTTKLKQKKLIKELQEIEPSISNYSCKGRSYIESLKTHVGQEYMVTLDVKDFFPSIKYLRVLNYFKNLGFNNRNSRRLTTLTTTAGYLPLGYCSSPILANLIFSIADNKLLSYCRIHGLNYTRYVDDIAISGKKIQTDDINTINRIIRSEGFHINQTKTKYYKPDENRFQLGLMIDREGIHITDEYRQKLEEDIFLLNELILNPEDIGNYESQILHVQGMLQYLRQVDQSETMKFINKCNSVYQNLFT